MRNYQDKLPFDIYDGPDYLDSIEKRQEYEKYTRLVDKKNSGFVEVDIKNDKEWYDCVYEHYCKGRNLTEVIWMDSYLNNQIFKGKKKIAFENFFSNNSNVQITSVKFLLLRYLYHVQQAYEKMNTKYEKKMIYMHVTTATDPSNIKKVFNDVQNIMIKKNLEGLGLY